MEEESNMERIAVNRGKAFGNVVYVLEGTKDEFRVV